MRGDLDFENTDLVVLECEMVGGLGGDFDFGGLGEERERRENKDYGKGRAMHDVDCNAGFMLGLDLSDGRLR